METIRRNRIEQFQKKMGEFQRKQEKKKLEIVAKLLKEEESIKQRDIPKLTHPPGLDTRKKRKRRRRKERNGEELRKRSGSAPTTPSRKMKDEIEELLGNQLLDGSDGGKNKGENPLDSNAQDVAAVVEPEIGGIWDEGAASPGQGEAGKPPAIWRPRSFSSKRSDEVGESSAVKKRVYSTAERRIVKATLDKLRKGIIRKQVAAGREFKVLQPYAL